MTELTAVGGYANSIILNSSFATATGVAVDRSGKAFVADEDNGAVYKLGYADTPSLSFATTAPGSTSSDSPQTITLTNNGNAGLTFAVPGTGLNPSISSGFTRSNASTCPQLSASSSAATLAAQTSCALSITFVPVAPGSITGALVLTDNALNAPLLRNRFRPRGPACSPRPRQPSPSLRTRPWPAVR